MENTSQNTIGEEKGKSTIDSFRWENLSIRFKVQLALVVVANIAIITVGALGYISATSALEKETYDQLTSVRETKRKAITDYFERVRKQVTTLSESRMTIDAMKAFKNASLFLDNDFYGDVAPDSMLNSLNSYYQQEFLPRWKEVSNDSSAVVDDFMIDNSSSLKLQYYYISGNPYPTGSKNLLDKAPDGSLYSDIHNRYHPIFRNYQKEFDFYDIFLADIETGRIIYSVSKEIDYMTSLDDGPYRESSIATAFRQAKESPFRNFTFFSDFSPYAPSYEVPSSFISSPIFDRYEKVGILIFQIENNAVNDILTGEQQWEVEGLGFTGETYLVGSDFKLRSDVRMLLENPDAYYSVMNNQYEKEEIENIRRHNSSMLFQRLDNSAVQQALNGQTGTTVIEQNYAGNRALASYSDLNIEGLEWAIISQIDESEALILVYDLRRKIIIAMIVIFLFTSLLGALYAQWFVQPIKKLRDTIIELSLGKKVEVLQVVGDDEIGQTTQAMNRLIQRTTQAADFAKSIGAGEFASNFEAMSEEDQLGNALTEMRNQLSAVAEADKRRSWNNEGIAQFADVLRKNSNNLEELSDQSLVFIIRYVGVQMGAFYLIEENNEGKQWLEMKACYAYKRKKFLNQKIEWGQGVVSQCWQDRDIIYMNDIPKEFSHIKTGIGETPPKALLLVPILLNDNIYGVIEVASVEEIPDYKLSFIQNISENIASTIFNVISNLKTARLLEESQQLAKELTTREEEMRQNMEELKATQEQIRQRETESNLINQK